MKIDTRWDDLTDAEWNQFAKCWLNGLADKNEGALPELPRIIDEDQDADGFVVQMNFTASHENQWKFIMAAFRNSSDEQLGDIAAGPIEHIMWKHGDSYVDRVEHLATTDPRFAKMIDGCWQHKMKDEIWRRIEAIQNRNNG